jgi:hypothetical protein
VSLVVGTCRLPEHEIWRTTELVRHVGGPSGQAFTLDGVTWHCLSDALMGQVHWSMIALWTKLLTRGPHCSVIRAWRST